MRMRIPSMYVCMYVCMYVRNGFTTEVYEFTYSVRTVDFGSLRIPVRPYP